MSKRVTVKDFQKMKRDGEKITMLTAYTFPIAKILDDVGIDGILVGDSLGMTVLGFKDTLKVTLDDTIRLTSAVTRATDNTLVIGDMPFLSYGVDATKTVENAGRLVKESGCQAVKLEGGNERIDEIKKIIEIGIPVMGHIGLTPTYINQFGGFKVQGKDKENAERIYNQALMLEEAGVFSIVLESIPWQLAKKITENISIPTIGIGAGEYCDGQVLVIDDLMGLTPNFKPKFVKSYANVEEIVKKAIKEYINDVKTLKFPSEKYRYD